MKYENLTRFNRTLAKVGLRESNSPFSELNLGGVSKSMLKKSRLNFDKIEKCK